MEGMNIKIPGFDLHKVRSGIEIGVCVCVGFQVEMVCLQNLVSSL